MGVATGLCDSTSRSGLVVLLLFFPLSILCFFLFMRLDAFGVSFDSAYYLFCS